MNKSVIKVLVIKHKYNFGKKELCAFKRINKNMHSNQIVIFKINVFLLTAKTMGAVNP